MLKQTQALLASEPDTSNPLQLLADVLAASIELVSLEGNDFTWSSWKDLEHALGELQAILETTQAGVVPKQSAVSILFAPTGSLQELSMSSGWAEQYLRLAERFDAAERSLWRTGNAGPLS